MPRRRSVVIVVEKARKRTLDGLHTYKEPSEKEVFSATRSFCIFFSVENIYFLNSNLSHIAAVAKMLERRPTSKLPRLNGGLLLTFQSCRKLLMAKMFYKTIHVLLHNCVSFKSNFNSLSHLSLC